jgi:N-acetylglucosaminyldiphosphoundecaprenol N-acetyl-beta-D-mannosaminyltransferase
MKNRSTIISMIIDITNIKDVINNVELLVKEKASSYICVSNVHMCMEVYDCPVFAKVVNEADLIIPDGRAICWAQKLLGHKYAEQVRGEDIMNTICESSGSKNLNIGLYGGSSDLLLAQVVTNLKKRYSDIQISYSYSPPFRPLTKEEDETVIDDINNAKVDILFVGIGCPKQERWMAEHLNNVNSVMLGVGAAFDFVAGSKKNAPKWMQKIGFEWLFRLCSEPSRLWKRYLIQIPRFIYHFFKQLMKYYFTFLK